MTLLSAALALAARGLPVFPITGYSKKPPLISHWPARATTNRDTIVQWWSATPSANIGVHCAGLAVIDVDVYKGGAESLKTCLDILDIDLPQTLTVRTPSGGKHYYFKLPAGTASIPNGVDVLGPGLDIRSTNGYVVGPGSVVRQPDTKLTAYTIEINAPIAEIPARLLEVILKHKGGFTRTSAHKGEKVPDAPEYIIERAREWLKTAPRSVRGQGGDQTAFRVAAVLRDFGLSYRQACELMRGPEWDHGCGWREGWLEQKPIRSAYKYASGKPGSRVAKTEDFPAITLAASASAPEPVVRQNRPLRLCEFTDGASAAPPYLVKGLLSTKSYALMYGAPGAGKTFVALDIAYHVASGTNWMGRRVRKGLVLYLPYEGAGGMRKRALGLRRYYGDEDVPLYIHPTRTNIRDKAGRQELLALIAELPEKPALIVFDTLAHALCGGDENSAQDVGAFNSAVQDIIRATGACVLVLHHPGKNAAAGARGSSALLGAVDTEIEVADRCLRPTKQRDIELGDPIGFKLSPISVGVDEDGDAETTCVVDSAAANAALLSSTLHARRLRPGSKQHLAFQILCDISPQNEPVTADEWRQACREFIRNSTEWADVRRKLTKSKLIVEDEDFRIRRRLE